MSVPVELLLQYGFPHGIVESLRADGVTGLLDQQAEAVRRFDLLGGDDLLVSLPTSAGKTLIGELCGIGAALLGKRAVFSVPLRALAREKFESFHRRYARYGLQVRLATGDYDAHMEDLRRGRYDVAVMIHEKLIHTLLKDADFLRNVGVVVLDELQGVEDPTRGPKLEFLLALLRAYEPGVRRVGLSGVLAPNDPLVADFEGRVLTSRSRPVDLREGIVLEGEELTEEALGEYGLSRPDGNGRVSLHRSHNTGLVEAENLPPFSQGHPPLPPLLDLALGLAAHRGESVLVFLPSRKETEESARRMAEAIRTSSFSLGENPDVPTVLSVLDDCFSAGVGFHHADCSPKQRTAAENLFREEKIRILCCTGTLAMGVNLPADNVLIHPYLWNRNESGGHLVLLPETVVRNMAGRAGRLGFGKRTGRALLVAGTRREWDLYRSRYWVSWVPALQPRLLQEDPKPYLLSAVAAGHKRTDELKALYEKTLSGRAVSDVAPAVEEGIAQAREMRLLEQKPLFGGRDSGWELTPLGRVVALRGIQSETGVAFYRWVEQVLGNGVSPLACLLRVCAAPEARMWNWPKDTDPDMRAGWVREIREHLDFRFLESFGSGWVDGGSVSPWYEDAAKMAWGLWLWCRGEPIAGITRSLRGISEGSLHTAGEGARWLLETLSDIWRIPGGPREDLQTLRHLALSVGSGLPDWALSWRIVPAELLDREEKIALAGELASPFALLDLNPDDLNRFGSPIVLEQVRGFLRKLRSGEENAPEEKTVSSENRTTGFFRVRTEGNEARTTGMDRGPLRTRPFLLDARLAEDGSVFKLRTWRQGVRLGLRSAELLCRLIRGRKESETEGWISRENLGVHVESLSQRISDLRTRLGPPPPGSRSWIESDHNGHYRLCCPASQILWEPETLPTEVRALLR